MLTLRAMCGAALQVSCMSFHPDGGMIATGRGEKIALWNAISSCPTIVDALEGHPRGVMCLSFSHQGGSDALLASGGGDRLVNIWSAPDGGKASLKHRLRGHTDEVSAFSTQKYCVKKETTRRARSMTRWYIQAKRQGKPLDPRLKICDSKYATQRLTLSSMFIGS